jgi:hypothetical protein
MARGREARDYLLTQAAYQFLYGIALVETRFVIDCCLNLIHNRIQGATELEKLQALTVIIDEGYHAHVALDYILQMKQRSGVEPILVPNTNRKLDAAARAYERLPASMHMDFQLLAVTLAESVLTDEIAHIGREEALLKPFTQVMTDHVRDEGRHSNYFAKLMKSNWARLAEETQLRLGAMLPDYLDDFLGISSRRTYERKVLHAAGFAAEAVTQIIGDTDAQFVSEQNALAEKQKVRLLRLLKQIGVLDLEPNRQAFSTRSYMS